MSIYTLNEQFDDAEAKILRAGKDKLQKKLKLKKLTWRKYLLLVSVRR